jgi:hypothetical protein
LQSIASNEALEQDLIQARELIDGLRSELLLTHDDKYKMSENFEIATEKYNTEIATLKQQHEDALATLLRHKSDVAMSVQQCNDEITTLKRQITTLNAEHTNKMDELILRHSEEIIKVRQESEREMKTTIQLTTSELQVKLQEDFERKLRMKDEQLQSVEAQRQSIQQKQIETDTLYQNLQSFCSELQLEYDKVCQRYERCQLALKENINKAIDATELLQVQLLLEAVTSSISLIVIVFFMALETFGSKNIM